MRASLDRSGLRVLQRAIQRNLGCLADRQARLSNRDVVWSPTRRGVSSLTAGSRWLLRKEGGPVDTRQHIHVFSQLLRAGGTMVARQREWSSRLGREECWGTGPGRTADEGSDSDGPVESRWEQQAWSGSSGSSSSSSSKRQATSNKQQAASSSRARTPMARAVYKGAARLEQCTARERRGGGDLLAAARTDDGGGRRDSDRGALFAGA